MAGSSLLAIIPLALVLRYWIRARRSRTRKISPIQERVLILGASSGIGRSIAHKYARRGAKVCVVARREDKVQEVVQECRAERGTEDGVLGCAADFTLVEDMVRVRNLIAESWEGFDTLIVAAGVSALRPLLDIAGLESARVQGQPEEFSPPQADREAIQRVVDVTTAATKGNYFGPLIAAVTFIPMLSDTSKSPSILLVSSLASLIPAPTRTIYASTKSASLLLYQALAIEHRGISFSLIMPSTVEGDFRTSAVDAGPVREQDPNKNGLKRDVVAERCIQAVDNREKTVFIPRFMRVAHILYWLVPTLVEWRASVKYGFDS
ncbi:NAD(P)-binding protein, partial [Macrolepiota fuliginosa MF-IS2]